MRSGDFYRTDSSPLSTIRRRTPLMSRSPTFVRFQSIMLLAKHNHPEQSSGFGGEPGTTLMPNCSSRTRHDRHFSCRIQTIVRVDARFGIEGHLGSKRWLGVCRPM